MRISQAEPFVFETPHGERVHMSGIPAGSRLALFGAGGRGSEVLRYIRKNFPDLVPVFFLDSFQNGEHEGLEVLLFSDFVEGRMEAIDRVIVCSFCASVIIQKLEQVGITDPLIATLDNQGGLLERMSELYPDVSDYYIESLEGLDDTSIRIVMATKDGKPDCRWSVNNGEEKRSSNGEIVVPGFQEGVVNIRGQLNRSIDFDFNLRRESIYEDEVADLPGGYYIFEPGNIRFSPNSWIDYGQTSISNKDRKYVKAKWAGLVEREDDYTTARAIAAAMISELSTAKASRPSLGDVFSYSPIEYYQKACKGKISVQCGQIAAAFQDICRTLGVMCRIVNVRRTEILGKTRFCIGVGHAVNEIYCRYRKQWIFMDLLYKVLGAGLNKDVLLNFVEFHSFVNTCRRKYLKVICAKENGSFGMQSLKEFYSDEGIASVYHMDKHGIFNMS